VNKPLTEARGHYDGIMLVVYRLSRLFKSKRCGTATGTRLATTRLRSAGG
jgi:hypothetical protein